jgi:hypothetical protein
MFILYRKNFFGWKKYCFFSLIQMFISHVRFFDSCSVNMEMRRLVKESILNNKSTSRK